MIPLLHDLSGETVLVFGGGSVGARKARRFAREAEVVVVAPSFADGLDAVDAKRVRAAPDADAVPTWFDRVAPALAVAATDDVGVNEAVEATADERGVLVNRTDESGGRDAGSVVVPATVRDGDVVVAVSTSGRSPALARYLRERVESDVEGAEAMAALTADLRADLQARDVDPERRRTALRAVVSSDRVWKDLRSTGANARERAVDVISDALGETE